MNTFMNFSSRALMGFLLGLPLLATTPDHPFEATRKDSTYEEFRVDVALDGQTNAQVDANPNDPNEAIPGGFARGDFGVVNGSIYSPGVVQPGTQNNDPEDPKRRIGKIICRAAYIISTAQAMDGATDASFVSELYIFDDAEHSTIIADGLGPTTGQSRYRAIVGGTGRFRNVVGELYEENVGMNKTGFCNFRLTFKLTRVNADQAH